MRLSIKPPMKAKRIAVSSEIPTSEFTEAVPAFSISKKELSVETTPFNVPVKSSKTSKERLPFLDICFVEKSIVFSSKGKNCDWLEIDFDSIVNEVPAEDTKVSGGALIGTRLRHFCS
jgi:hypothetical protein